MRGWHFASRLGPGTSGQGVCTRAGCWARHRLSLETLVFTAHNLGLCSRDPASSFPLSPCTLQILEPGSVLLEASTGHSHNWGQQVCAYSFLFFCNCTHSLDLSGGFSCISQAQVVTYPPTFLSKKIINYASSCPGLSLSSRSPCEPAIAFLGSLLFLLIGYLPSLHSAFVVHSLPAQSLQKKTKIKQTLEDIL